MAVLIALVATREGRTPLVEIDGHPFSVGEWTMRVPPDVPSADTVLVPLMPGQKLSVDGEGVDAASFPAAGKDGLIRWDLK